MHKGDSMLDKGVVSVLFDLSFSEFITTRIIKVLFILAIVGSALAALSVVIAGFSNGFLAGIASIVFAGVLFLLYVLAARVWCELLIAIFRIAENTSAMAANIKE
jgi:hypothetical protein